MMGTIIIVLIVAFFLFFWIKGILIISNEKKHGTPEYMRHYVDSLRREEKYKKNREEEIESMIDNANLDDPNYYKEDHTYNYRSDDDFFD